MGVAVMALLSLLPLAPFIYLGNFLLDVFGKFL